MSHKRKFNYNLISCGLIYAGSILFLVGCFDIDPGVTRIFPLCVCISSLVLATIYLILILLGKVPDDNISLSGSKRALEMGVLIALYVAAIYLSGYYIATLLYMPVAMIFLGQRNWKLILSVVLCYALIIYLFFGKLLEMQMPEGILF